MKKLLLATLLMLSTATIALAAPQDTGTGLIPGFDFAMQGELDSALVGVSADIANSSASTLATSSNGLNNAIGNMQYGMHVQTKLLEAGIAGATALAMLPEVDGGMSMSVGVYESGSSLAMGYSDTYTGGISTKFGMTIDSKSNTSFGAGIGYKFK